jgi:hypothetical protein
MEVINTNLEGNGNIEITATHSISNHILLHEDHAIIDYVEHDSYKYFKFVVTDMTNINSVVFDVSPIHGDCDIFISRISLYP